MYLFLISVAVTCLLAAATIALYPAVLWVVVPRPRAAPKAPLDSPQVSMLVAVHNGESCIEDKIRNALSLDYPPERFEVVVFSDGSTDGTEAILQRCKGPRVVGRTSADHIGKAAALNRGIHACRGEIIVFSDADALLERGALRALVRHFQNPRIGGVCGQRVISSDGRILEDPQRRYIGFDSTIKTLESRIGRLTSNDGKLYAIRRGLFRSIPEAVTDDLYVCLSIIRQGYDFIFEPEARAAIRLPSLSPAHEVERRRRIVSRSLRGIRMSRDLLDPRRYGMYSISLFINKVLRRFLPVCLILLFVSTAALSAEHVAPAAFLTAQIVCYGAALASPAVVRVVRKGVIHRAASTLLYFCVGNYGTLLGLGDFVSGRKVARWEPRKSDP